MSSSNADPEGLPGIFHFENVMGEYRAIMSHELAERHYELGVGCSESDSKLAGALAMASKISSKSLDFLIGQKGMMLIMLPEEDAENEFGKAINPDFRAELLTVMGHCCEVVLAIQDSINPELTNLMGKWVEKSSEEQRNDTVCEGVLAIPDSLKPKHLKKKKWVEPDERQSDVAFKNLGEKLTSALRILQGKKVHGKTRAVLMRHENGFANLPIARRIIDMTLEFATRTLRVPAMGEIQKAMEKAHPELLKKSPNWSAEFKKAGLSSLPALPPWSKSANISKNVAPKKKKLSDTQSPRLKRR